jgi:hypothetical protein
VFDRVRDWYDNLGGREKRIIGWGGVAAVVTIIVWAILLVTDGLNALEQQNEQTRLALDSLDAKRDLLLEERGRQGDVLAQIGAEAAPLAPYLEKVGAEVGVQIRQQSDRPPVQKGRFREVGKHIVFMDVTLDQLAQFLKRTEANPTIVTQRLTIKRSMVNKEKMDRVELDVATYEREKGAKAPAGGGGGGGAAGAGGGGRDAGGP